MQRVPTYRPTLAEALGGKPTKAELKVLACAKAGVVSDISPTGIRPEKATASTRIRAGLIRFLMLGGDQEHPVHIRGVLIQGAWIAGKLDMEACESQLDLKIWASQFDTPPDFDDAHLGGLYLQGCRLLGLTGQRLRLDESLYLNAWVQSDGTRLPFIADGTINIAGARIAGQLACDGGQFNGAAGAALDCGSATVGADVILSDGFYATGEVILRGAVITGQLACNGGRFDGAGGKAINCDAISVNADAFLRDGFHATGEMNLVRARITGNLEISNALIEGEVKFASGRVEEGLFFQKVRGAEPDGPWNEERGEIDPSFSRLCLDLTEARVGVLRDDSGSWDHVRKIKLSGFQYDSAQSGVTLSQRMALLRRAVNGPRFDPGPFTQHAQFLRRTGHRVDAGRMLFLRERLLRKAERNEAWSRGGKWRFFSALMSVRDALFQALIGFGYRPVYSLIWFLLIILWSTSFFGQIYTVGQFAPNSDVVLNSDHWLDAVSLSDALKKSGFDIPPLHLWAGRDPIAAPMLPSVDYETFGPFLYAVDLFLPLDTIGQTEAWAPSKDRGWWGTFGYYARMPIQLMGWLITALAAALLTGLIGRKED